MAAFWHLRSAHQTRARERTSTKSGFRHNFSKKTSPVIVYNLHENQVLKLKIDKVTVIIWRKSPFERPSPVVHYLSYWIFKHQWSVYSCHKRIAHLVERSLSKLEVRGSIPGVGSQVYSFEHWVCPLCVCVSHTQRCHTHTYLVRMTLNVN